MIEKKPILNIPERPDEMFGSWKKTHDDITDQFEALLTITERTSEKKLSK